jgi:two-component system sensor histidine kinase ChvG
MGEESRLARVFDNLVDNAISFSPEGGLIEIGRGPARR